MSVTLFYFSFAISFIMKSILYFKSLENVLSYRLYSLAGVTGAKARVKELTVRLYRIREGTMKSFKWIAMSSVAVVLVTTPTSWAAPLLVNETLCAASESTSMTAEGKPNGRSVAVCMDELLTEQSDLIDEVAGLVDDLKVTGLFTLNATQRNMGADLDDRITSLRSQHTRAMAASETVTDEEYDELLEHGDRGKGRQQCKLSDLPFFESLDGDDPPGLDLGMTPDPKFGDGKCNIFEATDIELDMTMMVNERKENMCERVCAEKEIGGQKQKGKTKERFTGDLTDGIIPTLPR